MSDVISISIAEEYSAYPAGRDKTDGPFNGKRFREELLHPRYRLALERQQGLVVSLDGVKSFGSSFLEEAFGGLARVREVDKRDLRRRLQIEFTHPGQRRYEAAIWRYIKNA